jgi:spore coat polysaccharide biosynthesis predicted glycosyltransferase SpsG
VQTSSINDILNKIDILVLDTQGVELEILKSIKKNFFSRLKLIIVEENHINNYKKQSNLLMIKNFFKHLKFIKVLKIKYEFYNKTEYYPAWSDNMYINFNLKKNHFLTRYYKFYKSKF